MSEENELSEEERDAKLMQIIQELSELGLNKEANQLFKKLEKKIEFVDLGDDEWHKHQICETYPKCDLRTMVYCCAPTNPCPYRNSVLRKLNLSIKDYIEVKKKLAEKLEEILKGRDAGQYVDNSA